jgi:hypothetical protein
VGTDNHVLSAKSRISASHHHDNVFRLSACNAKCLQIRRLARCIGGASVAKGTTQAELHVSVGEKYRSRIPTCAPRFTPFELIAS